MKYRPYGTIPELDILVHGTNEDKLNAVKQHYGIDYLLENGTVDVRIAIAENCNEDIDILKTLARDNDWRVRASALRNCNGNPDICKDLSSDDDYYVRKIVAEVCNKNLDVLQRLIYDYVTNFFFTKYEADEDRNLFLSQSKSVQISARTEFDKLLFDEDKGNHFYYNITDTESLINAIENGGSVDYLTNKYILNQLIANEYKWDKLYICSDTVRDILMNCNGNPDIFNYFIDSPDCIIREYVAIYCGGNIDILNRLAEDKDDTVRNYVAQNCNGNDQILMKLVDDRDAEVREAVAEFCGGNPEILKILINDQAQSVRDVAEGVLDNLLNSPKEKDRIKAVKAGYGLDILVNDERIFVREAVAENCGGNHKILNILADDDIVSVRLKVAQNCKGDTDVLVKLADDYIPFIAYTAIENCNNDINVLKAFLDNKKIQFDNDEDELIDPNDETYIHYMDIRSQVEKQYQEQVTKYGSINELVDIVVERYSKQNINVDTSMKNNIFYDLLGEYERNGLASATERAKNALLNKNEKKHKTVEKD